MLHNLTFNEEFETYIDNNDYQMGAIISQNGRLVANWLKKLTYTQKKYPRTGQESLAIVECLKQYKTILL